MNFGTRVLLPEEQIPYRERQEDVVYALENAFLRVRDELPFPVDFRKLQITERQANLMKNKELSQIFNKKTLRT